MSKSRSRATRIRPLSARRAASWWPGKRRCRAGSRRWRATPRSTSAARSIASASGRPTDVEQEALGAGDRLRAGPFEQAAGQLAAGRRRAAAPSPSSATTRLIRPISKALPASTNCGSSSSSRRSRPLTRKRQEGGHQGRHEADPHLAVEVARVGGAHHVVVGGGDAAAAGHAGAVHQGHGERRLVEDRREKVPHRRRVARGCLPVPRPAARPGARGRRRRRSVCRRRAAGSPAPRRRASRGGRGRRSSPAIAGDSALALAGLLRVTHKRSPSRLTSSSSKASGTPWPRSSAGGLDHVPWAPRSPSAGGPGRGSCPGRRF